jgi:hypothetical protein
MSLIQDWAEEGATPEERALVAASRSERPSASARTKTLAALGLGTVITATTVTATTTAAATTTGGIAFGTIGKIVAIVLIVGGASGGFAWHASQQAKRVVASPAATRAAAAVPTEPAPAPAPALEVSAANPGESIAAPRAASAAAVRAHPAPSSSSNTLSLEVAALEKAHAAIAAHDPAAALRALDRYRAQFPGGALSSEETVLRVQATLAQGDKSNAAALAKEFRATHPDSPYGKRVGDLVSNKAKNP